MVIDKWRGRMTVIPVAGQPRNVPVSAVENSVPHSYPIVPDICCFGQCNSSQQLIPL
jgi:hypothetical protein